MKLRKIADFRLETVYEPNSMGQKYSHTDIIGLDEYLRICQVEDGVFSKVENHRLVVYKVEEVCKACNGTRKICGETCNFCKTR